MNEKIGELVDFIKAHIQALDHYAELVLLEGSAPGQEDEFDIYIFTSNAVDYGLEQQYRDACVKVGLLAKVDLKLHLYSKEEWHKQHAETPLYQRVNSEGLML
ncbi:hypothetical protein [Carboxylicivirga sp. N1Y90]|uniref:hypothetical protein n=1 Tax=Carboxylicivirga fragile TaxID=3417571 RepID=UPI003D33BCF9|nr:hypothetical protein [Marinilabiliaceae bacterium N1Y90]